MTNSSSSSIILQQDQHAHGSHEEKLCQSAQFSTLLTPKRGVLQGSEHRNIAKNSAITTILQKKKCQNTATLQYRVKNRCHAETTTLFVTFRADNTEMVIIRICQVIFDFSLFLKQLETGEDLKNGGGLGG